MKPVRVLLVDDQRLFCDGLRALLETYECVQVVGEAHDGARGVEAAARLSPDVVLMDLHMPGMNGVEATQRIRESVPSARVIALTTFEDDENVLGALRAGASGYLLKDGASEQLMEAIYTAAHGESFLSPSVTGTVLTELRRLSQRAPDVGLSRRELEVLAALGQGASNKEIAKRLFIAEGTVKNHLTNIFEKLEVDDRTQAALLAKSWGIL